MAPDSGDMSDLEQPVTRGELRAELRELRLDLRAELFATKEELRSELAAMKTELRGELASKAALEAAKIELRHHIDATMKSFRDELRTHFDIIAESLRGDMRNMFDWMKANINGVTGRVDALETGHDARLTVLETRMTKLEASHN
jgi:hypothetical protein